MMRLESAVSLGLSYSYISSWGFKECEDVMMLSHAIEKFLEYQKIRRGRSKDTLVTYGSILKLFMEFTGDIDVEHLSPLLIDEYVLTLNHYKPKTIYNRVAPVKSMIGYLYSRDMIDLRKEAIDLPEIKQVEANFLNVNEQQQLINACKTDRELALILFFLRSGLRVSELANAKTDDLYERSLIVRKGKGSKPRITFITKDAEKAIRKYKSNSDYRYGYLFPNKHGGRLSRQAIHRMVSEIASRTDIPKKVTPHTLRHTFATNLLQAGARIEEVQPIMGHASIRTTEIYMHFTNDYLKERYDRAANALVSFA